jgi:hypothetical protein
VFLAVLDLFICLVIARIGFASREGQRLMIDKKTKHCYYILNNIKARISSPIHEEFGNKLSSSVSEEIDYERLMALSCRHDELDLYDPGWDR